MFRFVWPWAFLLLPLPIFIRGLIPAATRSAGQALVVPFFHAMSSATQKNAPASYFKLSLLSLIWMLIILSLSGPQWIGAPQTVKREGRNIILALDISGSMRLQDMEKHGQAITRLQAVKETAVSFIKNRKNDNLGLILFGTRAYLQTPLTYDHKSLLQLLGDASVGLAGQMTAIGDAIGLAVKRLKTVPQKSRVIILLTDGVSNAGVLQSEKAAQIANENHIKIYTIGLQSRGLGGLLGSSMMYSRSDLDDESLKKIAQITGGRFFLAQDLSQLKQVYKTIEALEPVKSNTSVYRPIKPYYYYPLALALFLSCLMFFPWRVFTLRGERLEHVS